jgi:hypothetical protein
MHPPRLRPKRKTPDLGDGRRGGQSPAAHDWWVRHSAALVPPGRYHRLLSPERGWIRPVGHRARRQQGAPAHPGRRQQRERGLGAGRSPSRLLVVAHGPATTVHYARGWDGAAGSRSDSWRGIWSDVVAAPAVTSPPHDFRRTAETARVIIMKVTTGVASTRVIFGTDQTTRMATPVATRWPCGRWNGWWCSPAGAET